MLNMRKNNVFQEKRQIPPQQVRPGTWLDLDHTTPAAPENFVKER